MFIRNSCVSITAASVIEEDKQKYGAFLSIYGHFGAYGISFSQLRYQWME